MYSATYIVWIHTSLKMCLAVMKLNKLSLKWMYVVKMYAFVKKSMRIRKYWSVWGNQCMVEMSLFCIQFKKNSLNWILLEEKNICLHSIFCVWWNLCWLKMFARRIGQVNQTMKIVFLLSYLTYLLCSCILKEKNRTWIKWVTFGIFTCTSMFHIVCYETQTLPERGMKCEIRFWAPVIFHSTSGGQWWDNYQMRQK